MRDVVSLLEFIQHEVHNITRSIFTIRNLFRDLFINSYSMTTSFLGESTRLCEPIFLLSRSIAKNEKRKFHQSQNQLMTTQSWSQVMTCWLSMWNVSSIVWRTLSNHILGHKKDLTLRSSSHIMYGHQRIRKVKLIMNDSIIGIQRWWVVGENSWSHLSRRNYKFKAHHVLSLKK